MLRTYAPLETMDRACRLRSVCGTSRRGLQMDRPRWGRSLFRSAGARSREDIYSVQHRGRGHGFGFSITLGSKWHSRRQEEWGAGTLLHAFLHYFADPRSIFLRRRRRQRASGPRSRPQAGSHDHLASERQTTRRRGADPDSIQSPAPGPRHLCHRGDHHGSADRRVLEQRQCQLFRAAALRFVASAPETLARLLCRRDAPFGR
jgi:hypothetical protein